MDRETLMMIATIVAIAGVIFLFREMNKAKQDVENLKNFSVQLVNQLSNPVTMIENEDDTSHENQENTTEENKEE